MIGRQFTWANSDGLRLGIQISNGHGTGTLERIEALSDHAPYY